MALNFYSDVDNARIRRAFGVEKYRRLVALKTKYDPDNVLWLNQNIPPCP
jgi:FAD/FMN-containing dehydrogenase